jgi:hypothetical protein
MNDKRLTLLDRLLAEYTRAVIAEYVTRSEQPYKLAAHEKAAHERSVAEIALRGRYDQLEESKRALRIAIADRYRGKRR